MSFHLDKGSLEWQFLFLEKVSPIIDYLTKNYFKTWLTRIVINKSKDYLKKQRFTEELTDNLNFLLYEYQ